MLRRLQQATRWFWHRQRLLALVLLWFAFIFAPTCCIVTCHLLFHHHHSTASVDHAVGFLIPSTAQLVAPLAPGRIDSATESASHQHRHSGHSGELPLFPRILYDALILLMLSIFCCILLHALAQPRVPWWPLPAPAPLTPPPR